MDEVLGLTRASFGTEQRVVFSAGEYNFPLLGDPKTTNSNKPYRKWSSANGKFQVDAKYVTSAATEVMLEKKDGTQITVEIEKLFDRDREYIRHRVNAKIGKDEN